MVYGSVSVIDVIMRLDTIITLPYAAVILDNAMGVVHFGRGGGGVEVGRQWAGGRPTWN